MVRGKRLQVLEEHMESMNPDENEVFKFLVKPSLGIKVKMV